MLEWDNKWQCHIEAINFFREFRMTLFNRIDRDRATFALGRDKFKTIESKPHVMMDFNKLYTLSLQDGMIQAMVNEFHKLGFRADGGRCYETEMDLVNKHLKDMRALVFKGKVKPEGVE